MSASRFNRRNVLVAVFDLAAHRCGAGIFAFLRRAELERAELNYETIHLVIVSDRKSAENRLSGIEDNVDDKRSPFPISMASTVLPTIEGYSICSSRAEADAIVRDTDGAVFPKGYATDAAVAEFGHEWEIAADVVEKSRALARAGVQIQSLVAPRQAEEYVDAWATALFGDRPLISVTFADMQNGDENYTGGGIGEPRIDAARLRILRHLDEADGAVVFVTADGLNRGSLPEAYREIPILPGSDALSPLRLALYRRARLNLIEFPASLGMVAGDDRYRCIYFGGDPKGRRDGTDCGLTWVDPDDVNSIGSQFVSREDAVGKSAENGDTNGSAIVGTVDEVFQRAVAIQRAGGSLTSAIKIYSAILRAHPDHAGALGMFGAALAVHAQYDEALPLLQQAVELDRTEPAHSYNLGALYLALGFDEKAVESFERTVRLDPDCHPAWAILGRLFQDGMDDERAVDCFERALTAPRKSTELMFCYAESLTKLGRDEEAAAVFERAGSRFVEFLEDEEATDVMFLSFRRTPYSARNSAFIEE